MKKTIDYLISLGLTKVEALIYEGLLQIGPTTVKELSESLRMKRITTHFNVESLIEKGLIIQTMQGARRKIMAEEPQKIKELINQKVKDIDEIKENFTSVIAQLQSSITQNKYKEDVDIKFYKGKNAVRSIYKEVLKSDEIRSFVNIKQIFKLFPENPQLFPKEVLKGSLRMWEIIEESDISKQYVKKIKPYHYQYKFFPSSWNQEIFFDYMISNNRISIITTGQIEPSGIVIYNKNVYEHTKFIFDLIWSLLPKIQDD